MVLKNKQNSLLIGISLFILLLTSTDTILFGTNSSLLFRYVPRIVGLAFSLIVFFVCIWQKKKINIPLLSIYLLLVLLLFASSIFNGDDLSGTFSRFISMTSGFAIVLFVDINTFKKVFSNFVFFTALVAIFTEIIAYVMPSIFNYLPGIFNSVNNYFKVFLIGSFEMSEVTNTYIRSNGIFWEPGAFAVYIIIALSVELFSEKKRIWIILIDCLAMFITFSTTGYLCLAVLFFAYLFKKSESRLETNVKTIIGCAAILLVAFLFSYNTSLFDYVFGKIVVKNSSAGSRFSSFFNGILVSIQHPLLGVGDSSQTIMNEFMKTSSTWYSINGGTDVNNTFVGYMVSYGIPFSLIMIFGSLFFFKNLTNNKICFILLFLTLLLAYSGERFFSFLPFAILFFGFKRQIEERQTKSSHCYEKNSFNQFPSCR